MTKGSVPLSRRAVLAFSLPNIATSALHGQMVSALPGIYALYFGLDLAVIGTAIVFIRLFDALTDPVVGYLSDQTRSRYGKRKPWIVVGAVLAIPTVLMFFIPHQGVGIAYYSLWYTLLYLAWTMIEIPTIAWQIELSHDYRMRTYIAATRFSFGTIGSIAFFMVPLLPFFASTKFTPETLRFIALCIAGLLPATILFAVAVVPRGKSLNVTSGKFNLLEGLKNISKSRPARLYFLVIVLLGLGLGMSLSSFFLYVDAFMQLGNKIAFLWTIPSLAMLVILPVWVRLCNSFSRHRVWSVSSILGAVIMFGVFLIGPGPQSFVPYLILLCVFQMVSAAGEVASPGVIGDVVDYDALKTGTSKAGQYSSIFRLVVKTSIAVGSALGFYQMKLFGFDPLAPSHDALAAFGIRMTVAGVPAILFILAALLIWHFPIDKRRQNIIFRRLETRPIARG